MYMIKGSRKIGGYPRRLTPAPWVLPVTDIKDDSLML